MDIHHESKFGQSEQIPNKSSCVLDSENCEGSFLDSNNNVCGNGVGVGIDVDNNLDGTFGGGFGGGVNVAEGGFNDREEFWGSYIVKDNVTKQGDEDEKAENNLVPGDCVSMFANIFGPQDDIYESEEKLGADDCEKISCPNCVHVSEGENILLNVTKNGSAVEEVEVDEQVQEEDRNFVLGDIVWVKTKTKLWWPGIITDPSNATKAAPKVSKLKDYFLVKQFANLSFVWASMSELKDFTCYFEEMVEKNKSRTFYGAVERAVNEIGCNVREKMTCSCFRKEIESSHSQSSGQVSTGAFSLSQFQPAQFLSFIRYLALDVSVPKKIQVTVTQNCLSAFYRSVGHCQMQIDQLRPNNTKNLAFGRKDENAREEESPVTKVWDGKESDNSKCEEKLTKSYQLRERIKSCSKVSNEEKEIKSSMKGLEKCVFGNSAVNITKIINSSSDAMLNDLCWTAVDDSSGGKERRSASLKRFFSCFRKFAFLQHEDGSLGIVPEDEQPRDETTKPKADDAAELPSSGIKPKRKWQRKAKINSESKDSEETRDSINPEKPKADDAAELPSSGIKPKRKWQRKSKINPESKDSSAVNEGKVGSDVTKCKNAAGIFEGKSAETELLPDLNANAATASVKGFQITGDYSTASVGGFQVTGDYSTASVGGFQVTGDYSTVPGEHEMFTNNGVGWLDSNGSSMTFVQLLQDVQGRGLSFLQSIPPENNECAENNFASAFFARQSEGHQINFASESSWSQPEANQINFASQAKANEVAAAPEPKKRKRKPKTDVTSSSTIPNLNGNIAETSATKETEKPLRKRNKSAGRQVCVQLTPTLKVTNTLEQPRPLLPKNGFKTVELPPGFGPQRSNTPDLAFIKQKLEMMKMTLEKSGNNLSPEVRGKLESEISGFSVKVNSMFGSPSS